MAHRTYGFAGGIQHGTRAQSAASLGLERVLRDAVAGLLNTGVEQTNDVRWKAGIPSYELAERFSVPGAAIAGIRPDGGVWLDRASGRPLVVAEAKKQGEVGNAIERWYKNFMVAQALGCGVYLTVCAGEGFFENRSAQATLETAVAMIESERHRLLEDTVWNHPIGQVWLYRYREVGELTAAMLETLIDDALIEARRR